MTRLSSIFLASTLLLLTACSKPQKPEFKGVDNITINMDGMEVIHVTGDAVFHNPNAIDIRITGTNLEVFIDGIPAGKLERELDNVLKANENSGIPIEVDLPTDKVFSNPLQMIGGALQALGGRKYTVQFKGTVTVKAAGINWDLPIDQTEEVSLTQ